MYIKKVHQLIEQGLQNIGVFAYADMLPEELDLDINAIMFNMMDEQVKPLEGKKSSEIKFKLQYVVDRFQNLQVKEFAQTPTSVDNVTFTVPIPTNYLHLISDISQILSRCNDTPILTGNVVAGNYYQNIGQKSIIYNTITYTTGSIFVGVTGVSGYTYTGIGTLLLVQLQSKKKSNRLTEEEFLYQVLSNALERTDRDSAVSTLSNNLLYVYTDGTFYIYQVFMTYLRKPNPVNSQFTTYTTSDNLVIGTAYESVDNPITYNTVVYQPFVPFIVISGHLTYSGTATVRVQNDGDTEFTDSISYNLVSRVIEDLSIKTEQNQQKINNLAQENV